MTFYYEGVDNLSINENRCGEWIDRSIQLEGKKSGNINCILCTDEYLLNINKTYLNHDTFTDIVTFNYVANGVISGDLFISVDRVSENADDYKVPFEQEIKRVIIHGVLHLIGYNDKTPEEAQEIRAKEDFYLTLWAD